MTADVTLKMKRILQLALGLVFVCLQSATRGAILPRLKNGENLKIAAIGTSLTDKSFNHNTG